MFSSFDLAAFLAYVNDVLQAIIVIFGVAVVLYNLPRLPRGAVIRSFSATIAFVVLVYLTELLVSRTIRPDAAELFLRVGWIGVAMVPAAQFHLSDALLTTTGKASVRRRRLVLIGYLSGLLFVLLGLFSDLVVAPPLATATTPRLTAGPYFFAFAVYYWVVAASSVYNVWRARSRCLTRTTRQRMTTTLLAILAAPLAVFPYTLLARDPAQEVPIPLWFVIISGQPGRQSALRSPDVSACLLRGGLSGSRRAGASLQVHGPRAHDCHHRCCLSTRSWLVRLRSSVCQRRWRWVWRRWPR